MAAPGGGTGSDSRGRTNAAISGTADLTTGNPAWTNYTFAADVKAPGGAAPFGIIGRWHDYNDTYMLLLHDGSRWQLAKRVSGVFTQLASGAFSPVTGTWYTLKLSFSGTTITASIDNTVLTTLSDSSLAAARSDCVPRTCRSTTT